ncbi:MAG TPA: polyprenyl diphosphate synthase [Candidatus Paceibacterota bacterium]
MSEKRLHILVTGRVQGVFYRASAKRVADQHGLTGFAKNLPDGRVEIMAEGSEAGLRALLDWCYRGSLLANVDSLFFEWQEMSDTPLHQGSAGHGFEISREDGSLIVDQVHALTNLGRRVLNKVDKKVEQAVLKVPKHVVIIPDGNRRWARERGLLPWEGHKEGMERTKELLKAAPTMGVTHMTFWGFSTENWSRPAEEVGWLMSAFTRAVKELGKELIKNKTAFRHLGRKDRLDPKLLTSLTDLENKTAHFKDKTFSMALDYGGRDEIARAISKLDKQNKPTNEQTISEALDTVGLPDPDLIIRTSGEQRLSGIMPWQGTYAELYFTPLHFPDFTADQLALALADYGNRQRRFGA